MRGSENQIKSSLSGPPPFQADISAPVHGDGPTLPILLSSPQKKMKVGTSPRPRPVTFFQVMACVDASHFGHRAVELTEIIGTAHLPYVVYIPPIQHPEVSAVSAICAAAPTETTCGTG